MQEQPPSTASTTEPIILPRRAYALRCLENEPATSQKSGSPMFKQVWEIFNNSNDKLNGVKIRNIATMNEKALGFFNQNRVACGLPEVTLEEAKLLNAKEYIGLTAGAICVTETGQDENEDGTPMVNPLNGAPVMKHQHKVVQWLGR